MPVTRTVLKKTLQQAVVKFVGDGMSNVTPQDLLTTNVTLDLPNVQMNITGIIWSTPGTVPIIITRNNSTVMLLSGNDNWSLSQMFGFVDTSNNSANITVTMPANSTMYLHISKPAGFIEPDQQTKR
jgi:hypothetical protein